MHSNAVRLAALCGLVCLPFASPCLAQRDSAQPLPSARLIGRWDVTVQGAAGAYPSWFQIRKSGHRTLVGSYVGQFGSARPIGEVTLSGQEFRFSVPPQWEPRSAPVVIEGRLEGDELRGVVTGDQGEALPWTARRAPTLDHQPPAAWSEPLALFNGRDLSGWKARIPERPNGWRVRDGALVNAEPGNDLLTQRTFGDFRLTAEFRYPAGSNSGIYLRGRYELQIEDNAGQEAESHKFGGVYGFLTPRINAALPAGQWQTAEITLVGRRVTVVLNGELVIDRQMIPGITGGALDSHEGQPGPILLQGDHGPVEFRRLTLRLPER